MICNLDAKAGCWPIQLYTACRFAQICTQRRCSVIETLNNQSRIFLAIIKCFPAQFNRPWWGMTTVAEPSSCRSFSAKYVSYVGMSDALAGWVEIHGPLSLLFVDLVTSHQGAQFPISICFLSINWFTNFPHSKRRSISTSLGNWYSLLSRCRGIHHLQCTSFQHSLIWPVYQQPIEVL